MGDSNHVPRHFLKCGCDKGLLQNVLFVYFNTLTPYNNELTIFMMKIAIGKIYLHNEKDNMRDSNHVPRHFLKCGCDKRLLWKVLFVYGKFLDHCV